MSSGSSSRELLVVKKHKRSPSLSASIQHLNLCVTYHSRPQSLRSFQIGAPQGKELGLMNPLSESSCNCFDNSFISDGANRYGARATDAALGIKSIWNSTGQAVGRPGRGPRNTSEKSRTI
ncbi:hypothetical protein Tco_1046299, partial [Tanacetum coccineum]